MDQSGASKKRKLEASKSQISTECDHCKVYVPSNGTEAKFECKICNISVQLIVKPLNNPDEVVRSFQENFAFEDEKPEIKIEPTEPPLEPSNPVETDENSNVQGNQISSNAQPESSPTQELEKSEKSYKCKLCDNNFDFKEDNRLKLHVILMHLKDNFLQRFQADLKCQFCSKDLTHDNAMLKVFHIGMGHQEVFDKSYEQAVKNKNLTNGSSSYSRTFKCSSTNGKSKSSRNCQAF